MRDFARSRPRTQDQKSAPNASLMPRTESFSPKKWHHSFFTWSRSAGVAQQKISALRSLLAMEKQGERTRLRMKAQEPRGILCEDRKCCAQAVRGEKGWSPKRLRVLHLAPDAKYCPRSSEDRASASEAESAGSSPAGGTSCRRGGLRVNRFQTPHPRAFDP